MKKKNNDISIALNIVGSEINSTLIEIYKKLFIKITLNPSFFEITLNGLSTLNILIIFSTLRLIVVIESDKIYKKLSNDITEIRTIAKSIIFQKLLK